MHIEKYISQMFAFVPKKIKKIDNLKKICNLISGIDLIINKIKIKIIIKCFNI